MFLAIFFTKKEIACPPKHLPIEAVQVLSFRTVGVNNEDLVGDQRRVSSNQSLKVILLPNDFGPKPTRAIAL